MFKLPSALADEALADKKCPPLFLGEGWEGLPFIILNSVPDVAVFFQQSRSFFVRNI
jgi:hypothetical protein